MRLLVLSVLVAVFSLPCAAQLVPFGFADEPVAASTLGHPSAMAFLPDGRVLLTELYTDEVKVVVPQSGAGGTLGVVPNVSHVGTERGLLAIAVDPAWPARPYVYVYYSHAPSPGFNWISMFTVSGALADPTSTALALGSRCDLITDIPDNHAGHDGASLRFGPDGMMYASLGDDFVACAAQTPGSFQGCILRLDVSAMPLNGPGPPPKSVLVPAGNPFAGRFPNADLVWAYGLRNPFRFHIDQPTGLLFIADVGDSTWEEIDVCSGGENFGWPWYEGGAAYIGCGSGAAPSDAVAPIAVLPAAAGWHAVITMGRYRNRQNVPWAFGPAYEGDLFFSDFLRGTIRRLQWNGTKWVPASPVAGQPNSADWATGYQYIVDADTGPDGALYYITLLPGALRRIRTATAAVGLSIDAGDDQVGNAGTPLLKPFIVRAAPNGVPTANIPVTFQVAVGSGTLSDTTILTDTAGLAQVAFTPGVAYAGNPVVTATGLGTTLSFHTVWRGFEAALDPVTHTLSVVMRHSETNSPFTVAIDVPPPAPYGVTPYGDLLTSIFEPLPTCAVFDGLGLLGPPDPLFTTGPVHPARAFTFPNVPAFGGVTLVFQGYAVDWGRWPEDDCYVVTNAVNVLFP